MLVKMYVNEYILFDILSYCQYNEFYISEELKNNDIFWLRRIRWEFESMSRVQNPYKGYYDFWVLLHFKTYMVYDIVYSFRRHPINYVANQEERGPMYYTTYISRYAEGGDVYNDIVPIIYGYISEELARRDDVELYRVDIDRGLCSIILYGDVEYDDMFGDLNFYLGEYRVGNYIVDFSEFSLVLND
jgi:hypothetical protein